MVEFVTNMGGGAQLILDITEVGVNWSSDSSTFSWALYLNCGNHESYNNNPIGWSVDINGTSYTGTYTFNFGSYTSKLIATSSITINHASNGSLSFLASGHTNSTGTSLGGPSDVGGTVYGTNIPPEAPKAPTIGAVTSSSVALTFGANPGASPSAYDLQYANNSSFSGAVQVNSIGGSYTVNSLQPNTTYWFRVLAGNASGNSGWGAASSVATKVAAPGAPTGLTSSAITPTSMAINWVIPSNVGGQSPIGYDLQWATNSGFTAALETYSGTSWQTSYDITGLNPGTLYYVRVRANNSAGSGSWSTSYTQTTLPSGPPSVSGTPAPSGRSATFSMTPPGGVTGVNSYSINLTDTVTGVTTPYSTTGISYTITGLTPGHIYAYSASAAIGSYTSPYSANQSMTMPSPSTNPGTYFDGAKIGTADTTYSWTGVAGESSSVATGKGVTGWICSPGNGTLTVLARVTGGFSGVYSGQMTALADLAASAVGTPSWQIMADPSNAQYLAAVEASTPYNGSIYVTSSKLMGIGAQLLWYDVNRNLISSVCGALTTIDPTTGWIRVNVTAISPVNAVYAAVAAQDQDDSSGKWVRMLSGDRVSVDAGMVMLNTMTAYFDGDSVDTPWASYSWLGTENASTSSFTPLTPANIDPLADPNVPAAPTAPVPPAVSDSSLENITNWRRYWVVVPASDVSTFLAEVPTVTLAVGSVAARQIRIRYYENPDNEAPADFDSSSWAAEQIVSYMPANSQLMIDGVQERVWAAVGGVTSISADKLLYGTGGIPPTWPVLSCGVGYLISFDTPLDSPSNNLAIDVAMTRRM